MNSRSLISKKFAFKISKLSNQRRYIPRHLIFISFVAFLILIIKRDKPSEYVNENSTLQLVFSFDMLRYGQNEVMGKMYIMIFEGMLFLSFILLFLLDVLQAERFIPLIFIYIKIWLKNMHF